MPPTAQKYIDSLNSKNHPQYSKLSRIENRGGRIRNQGLRIKDQGLRIEDWKTVNLLLSGTIYLTNFKALPSCYRKNLHLITWLRYSQRKYTLLHPLLLQFSERQQSPPTWKTCFHMTNICVSYRECLEKKQQWKMQQPNFTVCDDNFWNKMKLAYFWHFQKGHMSYYMLFFPKYVHTSS